MSPANRSFAQSLRQRQSDAEHRLWFHLRAHRMLGYKFKRQVPIGRYIVDFLCMRLGLVVGADGGQHANGADIVRDQWLASQGLKVLRFWNHDVLQQTEAVLEAIRIEVEALAALSPIPSPASGRGERGAGERARKSTRRPARAAKARAHARRDGFLPSPARGRGAGGEGTASPARSAPSIATSPADR
ncbi:endonuclease domain-containing protein [Cupriavidus gilardii]|uniref:endonuclease domain-containing protein n=1 Tax=Cupriavidus gilardii TaxID=82541 RepID=UPI001ABE0B5D|nr:endonuclease domain-containing protein [Cupriavidus gilardii]